MRKIVLNSMMAVALALPMPVLACPTGPTISDFGRFDQWLRNQSEVEGTIVFRNSETADDPDNPDYQATLVHATITSANDGKVEVTLFNPGLITAGCGVRAIIPADGASGFFYVSDLGQVVHWSEQRLPPPAASDFGPAAMITPSSEPEDCADVTPNAAYTECFRQLAISARKEVDVEIAKARKLLAAADEEYSRFQPASLTAEDKTQLARHLAVSQENWLRYAEGQCELEATAARGGSGTDTLRQKCLLRLGRLRLAELRGAEALIDGNR